jgi:hypothetical protein
MFFAAAAVAFLSIGRVGDAGLIQTSADLSGPAESPPNASTGTGSAEVDLDTTLHTLHVDITFSGLTDTTTSSHIHAATAVPGTGTAMVATQTPSFSGFPLGVTSGTYDHTFDTTLAATFNPAYVTANGGTAASAEAALATALLDGTAYLNIHTRAFPGGEIRGFLAPVAIPEPSTLVMSSILLGMFGAGGLRARLKRAMPA